MAENSPVNLDKAWLQNFLDVDVAGFIAELDKITKDGVGPTGEDVPALANIGEGGARPDFVKPGAELPLTIGIMKDNDKEVSGKNLQDSVKKMITNIKTILEEQKTLFGDIDDNLRTSIEKLFKTQGDNLAKIEGDKFLDIFEDVDETLGGGESEDD
ncbi:type VII secretion system-associated protein [Streptomyces sp. NPDC046887]|uniref:type VII secretion system-associated protein n=1 Tax=Streptomyces sp. NPDC046887 TaxID=3155472 RepID=UPI00340F5F7F